MTPPHDPRLDVAGGGLAVRAAKSNAREESFQQIMARELARAPWFILSLATHALLLLLVNWLIVKPPPGDGSKPWIQLAEKEGEETIEGIATTEDAIQVEKSDGNEPTTEPEIEPRQSFEPAAAELDFDPHGFDNVGFAGIGLMRVRGKKGGKGDGGGDIFALGSDALRKGSLRGWSISSRRPIPAVRKASGPIRVPRCEAPISMGTPSKAIRGEPGHFDMPDMVGLTFKAGTEATPEYG